MQTIAVVKATYQQKSRNPYTKDSGSVIYDWTIDDCRLKCHDLRLDDLRLQIKLFDLRFTIDQR